MKRLWNSLLDVRPGEYARTVFMSLYLLFVMVAYYILKPVAAAMFLHRFNIDQLPYLYILIAVGGGVLAYFYTNVALKASLSDAVTWAMGVSIACLIALWWLIGLHLAWMLYVFNVWVSLFSIVLVSQGWLVASSVFDARQAKRLYGLLGLGAVVGGGIGAGFTAMTVKMVGPRNLILVCAATVAAAYGCFRLAVRGRAALAAAPGAKREAVEFSFDQIVNSIRRYRHLQVIIAIILLTFIVDELVDFQFQYMAKHAYPDANHLTAFIGAFYAYLSIISFLLQFFLTAWVVQHVGVGGALQIMPVSLAIVSLGTVFVPNLISTVATRFTEAVNRYTFNRTAMELLILPLPAELRNRTKAFVDIFVDRLGRGIAGVLLMVLLRIGVREPRWIALITIGFATAWVLLARRARHEYITTVRDRLERRRLDLGGARTPARDPAMVRLLEQMLESGGARQIGYALSTLAEMQGYDLAPALRRLAENGDAEVRARVFDLARARGNRDLIGAATREIESAGRALEPAMAYLLSAGDWQKAAPLAREYLKQANPAVAEAAIEAIARRPQIARAVITTDWLRSAAHDFDPARRRLAALAIGARGGGPRAELWQDGRKDEMTESLLRLVEDRDSGVAAAACASAGALRARECVEPVIRKLDHPALRAPAIQALAAYGELISGVLGDFLADGSVPLAVRRQIPRVLKRVPHQRSVDVLVRHLGELDLALRAAVLKALNTLRENASNLDYGEAFVVEQILNEARNYFEMYAALEPFREENHGRSASGLLQRTIEERLKLTQERLFRLLGLRYPPAEIQAAFLAVKNRRREEFLAAMEFLDNVLERPIRRVLIPMLDASDKIAERGRELFGVEVRDAESTIRELIISGDPWLAACAMATAAERGFRDLAAEIRAAGRRAEADVALVARDAVATLVTRGTEVPPTVH